MPMCEMDRRGNHACGGRCGHSREVAIASRRHTVDIESGQTPRAAGDKDKTDKPSQLRKMQCFGRVRSRCSATSPSVSKKCGRNAEADDVRERIEFLTEFAFGLHGAGDSSIERIEKPGQTDSHRGVIEVGDFSVEGRENRVIPAKHVGNGKRAGEDINAAAETMIAERAARAFFVSDGIYAVKFHFASMLSPPLTFCPRLLITSVAMGNQTSTREPKRIRPTRSPIATSSPSAFQHITRRAIAPAICLKTNWPAGV